MLYVLGRYHRNDDAFKACQAALTAFDQILLLNDAVYYLAEPAEIEPSSSRQIFALKEDCDARALDFSAYQLVTYRQSLELFIHHEQSCSWR